MLLEWMLETPASAFYDPIVLHREKHITKVKLSWAHLLKFADRSNVGILIFKS